MCVVDKLQDSRVILIIESMVCSNTPFIYSDKNRLSFPPDNKAAVIDMCLMVLGSLKPLPRHREHMISEQ